MADATATAPAGAEADTMARWRALAERALKGAPLDSLSHTTADGLTLAPLHGPAPPRYAGRATAGPWQVVQRVDRDEGAASQARDDLTNGATALCLTFAGAPLALGRGLVADTVDDLDRVLDGVLMDLIGLHVEAGGRQRQALALVLALADKRGTIPAELHAALDPIGAFAATGTMAPWDTVTRRLADTVGALVDRGVAGSAIVGDGRALAEAGATPVQELAFAIAALVATVRALDEAGLSPDITLPRAAIALTASADQFATIAKLRAARRLFALFATACGVETPCRLHVTTAQRMLSRADPHTNLLRLTIAAFAAGAGGADALTVLPFDAGATPFSRRMARNIQSLLIEEAHVARMADPAAGAGALEAYTDALAEAAWTAAQDHDAHGLVQRIASGHIAREVERAAAARQERLAAGEATIIGVTQHKPQNRVAPRALAAAPDRRGEAGTANVLPDDTFAALSAAAQAGATLADLCAGGTAAGEPLTAPVLDIAPETAPFEE